MRRLINIRPGRGARLALGLLPLLGLVFVYAAAASLRHAQSPSEKILPTLSQMAEQARIMAFEIDPRTGAAPLWQDTAASLTRLGLSLLVSTAVTLAMGLALGVLPLARAGLGPFIATLAVIPPIAVLPILFITFGLGETSKIVLIIIGVSPFMIRDLASHVAAIPQEQIVKAQTLGASTWQIVLRVALPQAMPRLITSLRLSLGPAWVFLISAEAIASDVGLGYRIFLVRRYLAMDIILPYVAWTAFLAVALDQILLAVSRRAYPWAHAGAPG